MDFLAILSAASNKKRTKKAEIRTEEMDLYSELSDRFLKAKTHKELEGCMTDLNTYFISAIVMRDIGFFKRFKNEILKYRDKVKYQTKAEKQINKGAEVISNNEKIIGGLDTLFLISNTLLLTMPEEEKLQYVRKKPDRINIIEKLYSKGNFVKKDELEKELQIPNIVEELDDLAKNKIVKKEGDNYRISVEGGIIANYLQSPSVPLAHEIENIWNNVEKTIQNGVEIYKMRYHDILRGN